MGIGEILAIVINLLVVGCMYGILKSTTDQNTKRLDTLESQKGERTLRIIEEHDRRIEDLEQHNRDLAEAMNEIAMKVELILQWVESQKHPAKEGKLNK